MDRSTRFRWLAGKRAPQDQWNAYEFAEGGAFHHADVRIRTFQTLARWLESLARECRDGGRDGTLREISLDTIWLTRTGDIKVADWRIPGIGDNALVYSALEPRACQRFLIEFADRVLNASRDDQSWVVPLYGRALLSSISRESFDDFDDLVGACSIAAHRESAITSRRRVTPMLLPLMLVIGVLLPEVVILSPTPDVRLRARLQFSYCLQELQRMQAQNIAADEWPSGRASTMCVAVLSRVLDSGTVLLETERRQAPMSLIDTARARYPSATLSDLSATASKVSLFWPLFQSNRAISEPPRSETRFIGILCGLGIEGGVYLLAEFSVIILIVSAAAGDGPLYRIMGLAVARPDGHRASRLRHVTRNFVIWSPVIAVVMVITLTVVKPPPFDQRTPWHVAFTVALAMMGVGALCAIRHPHRGLAERMTGTCLVRR